jgi:hypothetical protein
VNKITHDRLKVFDKRQIEGNVGIEDLLAEPPFSSLVSGVLECILLVKTLKRKAPVAGIGVLVSYYWLWYNSVPSSGNR